MKKHKRLFSALLTSIFLTTSIPFPASAADLTLAPRTDWSLTKIDRTAEGGKSYCTLSRKYDNGVVLSLARNQAEEYSLAVDFQKDVFKPGESLKINLQPGPGQIRAYDMMPSSEKAVVIRLGWDTGFFDALNASQKMKVRIGDQGYSFPMPQIANGQDKLKSCMEELQIAAKGGAPAKPTTDVLAAAPTAGASDFAASKIESRTAQMASAKEEVEAQEKAVLENFARSIEAREPSLTKEKTQEPAQRTAKAEVTQTPPKKPENIDARNAAREEAGRVAAITSISPAAGQADGVAAKAEKEKAAALQRELDTLAAANAALKKKKDEELAKSAQQIESLKRQNSDELSKTSEQLEVLKNKNQADLTRSAEQITALQARLNQIAKENDALKAQSAQPSPQAQQRLAEMADEQKQLEERLVAAESEKAMLSVEQVNLATRTAELEKRNAELAEALRQTEQKMAEASSLASQKSDQQVKTLQARLSEIVAENERLKEQSKTAQKTEAEKLKLEASLKETQQKADAAARASADLKAMQDRVATMEAEKAASIAAIEAENAALKEKAQTISPDAQKKIDAAEAEKKALEAKLADAQKQAAEAKAKAEAAHQLAMQQPESGAAGMTPLPVSAEQSEMLEKTQAEKKALEEKVAALEKTLAETATQAGGDTNTQIQIKQLEAKNAQLEEALKSAQTRIAEAALNTEGKAIRKITELESKLEAAQSDNKTLAKQLESLRTQKEDARLNLVAGDWTLEQATKRFNEAEREIKRLGQQLEKERMACNREKSQIEQMLFDPAVTERKQIEKLRALEAELEEARARLGQPEARSAEAPRDTSVEISALGDMGEASWTSETPASSLTPEPASPSRLSAITPAAGTVSRGAEPAPRAAEPVFQTAAIAAPKPSAKPASPAPLFSESELSRILKSSGISGELRKNGAESFAWNAGGVKGVANIQKAASFRQQINAYIAQQKSRCDGDFASIPSPGATGGKTMERMEIACVSGGQSVAYSVLFFEDKGRFVAVSNETDASQMDTAMDMRDRIADAVQGM